MKARMFRWVMAATLICGAVAFTACSNDDDNSTSKQEEKGGQVRQAFIANTRANLKDLAENLNFSSWEGANHLNSDFNTNVLNNPAFDKTISMLFAQLITQNVRLVEEGSELAQLGYERYVVVDLTQFNFRFTQNEDNTGFDVEPAEDFEMIFKRTPPQRPEDGMEPEGEERPEIPEGVEPHGERNDYARLVLKASGSVVNVLSARMSTEEMALIIRIPTAFAFTLDDMTEEGESMTGFSGTFKNEFASRGSSSYINLRTDTWNISGELQSKVNAPKDDERPQDSKAPAGGPKEDATTVTFSIGQNPGTHKGSVELGFVHNNRKILNLSGVMKSLNGQTDYTTFTSSTSLSDAFIAIMAGNSMEEGTLTLLDDMTISAKISDCQKALELRHAMARARRYYADEQTIDGYAQQLNQVVTCSMTAKALNQQLPMKMQTIKFGIDYHAVPSLKFPDENEYVPFTELLDQESVTYAINIADHAMAPMQESLVVIRQLRQYLRTMMGYFQNQQQQ
jgi:hypothetical protein